MLRSKRALLVTMDLLQCTLMLITNVSHTCTLVNLPKIFNGESETSVFFRLAHRFPLHSKISKSPENGQTLLPPYVDDRNLVHSRFIVHTHRCTLKMIICLLVTDLFQRRFRRGGPCNFPRSWLLPVLKDNVKDTELKYFFDVMLPLSANLRNKGNNRCKRTTASQSMLRIRK